MHDACLSVTTKCRCCWSVLSDSLPPHGLQHTRLPCISLSPGVCSNPCPLSQWSYLTISSSAASFSFCPQSFPASGFFFPTSWLFILFVVVLSNNPTFHQCLWKVSEPNGKELMGLIFLEYSVPSLGIFHGCVLITLTSWTQWWFLVALWFLTSWCNSVDRRSRAGVLCLACFTTLSFRFFIWVNEWMDFPS